MRHRTMLAQNAVETRLAAKVFAEVGQVRHDLLRRHVAELRARGHLDDSLALKRIQLVGRRCLRSHAAVFARSLNRPALIGSHVQTNDLTCSTLPRTIVDGLCDDLHDILAIRAHVSSPPSPQIAWTFFWSTS